MYNLTEISNPLAALSSYGAGSHEKKEWAALAFK